MAARDPLRKRTHITTCRGTARAANELGTHLSQSLQQLLPQLGVSEQQVKVEIAKMSPVLFAPTRNKRILGTMNSLMDDLSWYLGEHPKISLLEASLHLAETPCAPIEFESPNNLTAQLFAHMERSGAAVQ